MIVAHLNILNTPVHHNYSLSQATSSEDSSTINNNDELNSHTRFIRVLIHENI